jgi:hypothetical protein
MNPPRIFARSRAEPLLAKPVTVTDVVATVRRPAAFQAAQTELDQLHARREETHAALLAAIRDQPRVDQENTASASTRLIEKLGRELAEIDKQIQVATAEWEKARAPFTTAVASALAPMRRSAVDAATTAVGELVAALRIIDAINIEITRSGGTAMRFPPLYRNAVGALRARLQHLAGGAQTEDRGVVRGA